MSRYDILQGDAGVMLATLEAESVQTCVTSPPYFGLRNYGVDGQIGLEQTPDAYVARLVEVFRQVRRVLKPDGTLWLNLGDSYGTGNSGLRERDASGGVRRDSYDNKHSTANPGRAPVAGMFKQLLGMPWRVAFALQADGWWLRSAIVWHKPSCMPESVTDRPTSAYEMVFLLAKAERYYYDAEAIAEPASEATIEWARTRKTDNQTYNDEARGDSPGLRERGRQQYRRAVELAEAAGLTDEHIAAIRAAGITDTGKAAVTQTGAGKNTERVLALAAEAKAALGGYYREFLSGSTRNARNVWTIATQPFGEAHFATMPPELARRCILAGSREGDTVLDCFNGAATTGVAALETFRNYVGIELNPEYIEISRRRLDPIACQPGLFEEVAA